MPTIYPRCKGDLFQVYVTAEGYVVPCCWIGNEPDMSLYREWHKDHLEDLSLKKRALNDILNDPRFLSIERSWETDAPFEPCQWSCSKPLERKWEEAQGTNEIRSLSLKKKKNTESAPVSAPAPESVSPSVGFWERVRARLGLSGKRDSGAPNPPTRG